jgi:hypothetical protein
MGILFVQILLCALWRHADRHPGRGRRGAAAVLLAAGLGGCADDPRPERAADLSVDDARRVLAGSFALPDAGAPAHPAGGAGGAAASSIALDAGGAPSSTPVTVRNTYAGECEDPGLVQWGFLTYDASTPGDSSIAFRIRSAPSRQALERATFRELITASAALGTERCRVTGPAPCPIDLFLAFGGAPLAHHPFAELELELRPSSGDGALPAVEEWKLNYSCTFNH